MGREMWDGRDTALAMEDFSLCKDFSDGRVANLGKLFPREG